MLPRLATGDREGVVVSTAPGAAFPPAVGCRCGEAVGGAFLDQVAFHLGCRRGDHEKHLVGNG
jgi:hypothetical protein